MCFNWTPYNSLYMLSAIVNKNVAHLQALCILGFSEVNMHCITEADGLSLKCFQISDVIVLHLYTLVNTARHFLCIYEKCVSNKI